ncbi:nucleotidyltransferase [Hallella multisaccharivorax DSM 17128]|uniref:Nucleotidyltransferase substrate binding protein, HI0074 family n=1 Tax=Hallella multisaccharivorax DSM 17128 TaxID=688246 RepID=F8N9C8_9BACT|nr:nucleotidyltransferase substrate binding protein [Hallella multisaccharivorax]EGN57737.1 nucleotidyltransferase substrate binding protein, HI0074 family [Hallella multisaccharivorax DSM 17128]GJG31002.1 nucleotidyltransferase [Hallella multisaccharivorax DSM 17128]
MTNDSVEPRWHQRLATFRKALARLGEVVELHRTRPLTALEKDGMVQRFEYTQELAWKVLKNYLEYQGEIRLGGSRDTIRQAFAMGIIANTDPWFDMLESRNETSHVYDEDTEEDVIDKIMVTFYPILCELQQSLTDLENKD